MSIRSLLEAQLGRLLWDENSRQSPAVATLLRHFTQLGLDPDIARQLDVTEGAARVAVYRLRKRYRHLLTGEISRTLASPDAVEEDIEARLEQTADDLGQPGTDPAYGRGRINVARAVGVQ